MRRPGQTRTADYASARQTSRRGKRKRRRRHRPARACSSRVAVVQAHLEVVRSIQGQSSHRRRCAGAVRAAHISPALCCGARPDRGRQLVPHLILGRAVGRGGLRQPREMHSVIANGVHRQSLRTMHHRSEVVDIRVRVRIVDAGNQLHVVCPACSKPGDRVRRLVAGHRVGVGAVRHRAPRLAELVPVRRFIAVVVLDYRMVRRQLRRVYGIPGQRYRPGNRVPSRGHARDPIRGRRPGRGDADSRARRTASRQRTHLGLVLRATPRRVDLRDARPRRAADRRHLPRRPVIRSGRTPAYLVTRVSAEVEREAHQHVVGDSGSRCEGRRRRGGSVRRLVRRCPVRLFNASRQHVVQELAAA